MNLAQRECFFLNDVAFIEDLLIQFRNLMCILVLSIFIIQLVQDWKCILVPDV